MINRDNKLRTKIMILSGFLACIIGVFSIFAAGPGTITYQGTVTDSVGAIPPDSSYAMRFTLFDALSAGSQKWQETHSGGNAVPVTNGCFSAQLGSITSFPADLFQDNANLWLEIEVDLNANGFEGTEKYSPRAPFTAAPYAFQSDKATTATCAQSLLKNLVREFLVASGENISAGNLVVFLNGTVKKGINTQDFSSNYTYNSAQTLDVSAAALSGTKFVVAYRDGGDSGKGMAVVGNVSGNTISYGSEFVFNNASTEQTCVAALSSTKFVVAYTDIGNSDYGTAIVGNVTGSTISYGSEYVYNSAPTYMSTIAGLSESKFVVDYVDGGNSNFGTGIIGDVSGGDVINYYGLEYVFNFGTTNQISIAILSSTKFVTVYSDSGSSFYGTAVVGDVNGSIINFGSEFVYNSAGTVSCSSAAISDSKFIVAYCDAGNSNYGTAMVGDVNGRYISYGSEYVYNSASTDENSVAAISEGKFVIAYKDDGNSSYGTAVAGDVSGTALSFGPSYVFNSNMSLYNSAIKLSSTEFVIAYANSSTTIGVAVLGELGVPLGIAEKEASSGEILPVILQGISDKHTGLIPGKFYYTQTDGLITATESGTRVGVAISPTELLLDIER